MDNDVFDDPEDSREEILAATYRALSEYGYADLTIQRIGDEFDKSTGLLYYHYESKDELVLATLEFLLSAFEDQFTGGEMDDPTAHIEGLLSELFNPAGQRVHLETLIELRARATHDDAYRHHFTRSDQVFEDHVAEIVRAGIESGAFRECDPDAVATAITTFVNGVLLRRSTNDSEEWLERARNELDTYLAERVYAPDTD